LGGRKRKEKEQGKRKYLSIYAFECRKKRLKMKKREIIIIIFCMFIKRLEIII
jgi:hypothetical protein